MARFDKQDILGIGMTSQRRRDQLIARLADKGVKHADILQVMRNMPRHLFIDEAMANRAYEDCSLPIGFGQTISQPFIVARMTEVLLAGPAGKPNKVLEVGTGSGYQTAILAMLVEQVFSVERLKELHLRAKKLLGQLQLSNVALDHSDGSWGWDKYAPYDGIIVTAAPEQIPEALLGQLAIGGRMVIPVGTVGKAQQLTVVERTAQGFEQEIIEVVSFVPFLNGCS